MKSTFFNAVVLCVSLPISAFAQRTGVEFAVGSCAELSTPEREEIFTSILAKKPEFFFWLGDNTYYKSSEWNDSTLMAKAWTRRHASPPLAAMMSAIPQRAIWDDHDYGPNDGDSTYSLRETSAKIFSSIWKDTPFNYAQHRDLRWVERKGDVVWIGLDDRTHRGPVGTQVLGRGQLDWLSTILDAHADARVIFIAVGSQVLNLAPSFENLIRYPNERLELLDRCSIAKAQVVFLTGDRHHGEIEELTHKGVRFIEICSSPLTSKVFPPRSPETEQNTTIVGKPISETHFTCINVTDDVLRVEYFNTRGETIVNVTYEL